MPEIGDIYVARNRSGRRWKVWALKPWGWGLMPLGDRGGGFGGVKNIWRSTEQLQDPTKWEKVSR